MNHRLDVAKVQLELECQITEGQLQNLDQSLAKPYDVPWDYQTRRNQLVEKLERLTIARQRLQAGSYGICTACKQPIPAERLEALPEATMCLTCVQHSLRNHVRTTVMKTQIIH